jgi:protein-S-isoprenylcysteine O-methyltransferase Ste14
MTGMQLQTDAIGVTTLILVLLPWLAVVLGMLLRKKPAHAEETKHAPPSLWGIALKELALGALAILLTYASACLAVQAVRALGKQWTYQARVIEGHELVTQGPYSLARNPIYLGMFGAILGAGLVFARWWTLLAALVLFLVGNHIRITAEERLLREGFGAKFDDYARRVPAFLPRPF